MYTYVSPPHFANDRDYVTMVSVFDYYSDTWSDWSEPSDVITHPVKPPQPTDIRLEEDLSSNTLLFLWSTPAPSLTCPGQREREMGLSGCTARMT